MNTTMHEQRAVQGAASLRRRLLPLLIAGCFAGNAIANPLGPQVVNGQAGFINQGNTLSVTNTPGAIINWQSFSINPGELTRFIQQNPNSAVLNRITGGDPSQILGALQSNGKVFLINPNGILFGQGAQIDVNGLVASSLNISNEDFLTGRLNFKAGDKTAAIRNQGVITTPSGGQVYLIAPNVENSGIITSPKGEVVLAAGHSVQLVDSANPDLHVVVSAPDNEALNLGQIVAHSGKVGIYGALVKQRGIVNANSAVVGENGKIVFKASKDTVLDAGSKTSATGEGKGGEIQVLGERVGLMGDAQVDASGKTGGGTVLVGGDYQGKNPQIENAKRTYFGQDAVIKVDATDKGDGGKAIVWADDTTRAYGKIFARGGEQGGNGGFVEVSGKNTLGFSGHVDTSAVNGKTGSLLLDPVTIDVVATTTMPADALDGNWTAAEVGATQIGVDNLQTLLGTTDVRLEAQQGITWASGVVLDYNTFAATANNRTLKLIAGTAAAGNIAFDGKIWDSDSAGDKLNVILNSNQSGAGGGIALSGGIIETNGGNITLGGGTNPAIELALGTAAKVDGISLSGSQLNASGGNLILRGQSYGVATTGYGVGVVTSSTVQTSGSGTIDIEGRGNLSTSYQQGVVIQNSTVRTADGNLNIVGVGGSPGADHARGIEMSLAGIAEATGLGNVTLSGTGGTSTGNATGVWLFGTGSRASVASGMLSVSGSNTAGTATNAGIQIESGAGITAGSGPVVLHGTGSGTRPGLRIINNGSFITSTSGNITLTADRMDLLSDASSINAGAGTIWVQPATSGRAIDLGSAVDTNAALELSTNELNVFAGTGILRLGALAAGDLNVSAAIAPTYAGGVVLEAGGAVTQAGAGTISIPKLGIKALGSVTLNTSTNPNSVTDIAAQIGDATHQNNDFKFKNSGTLNVAANIGGMTGINLSLDATGYNSASQNGVIALESTTAGITQSATATLGGKAVNAVAYGSVNLQESNPTGIISGASSFSDFAYRSANGVNVNTVAGYSGISAGANNILLQSNHASGISQSLGAAISTTGGLAVKAIGPVKLTDTGNTISKIAANITGGGNFALYSGSALNIDSILGVNDINSDGKVVLLAGNNVTQSSVIIAPALAIISSTLGSTVALNSANKVGTLAAVTNGGALSFTNTDASLTVGTVSDGTNAANGITTNNSAVSVTTTTTATPINLTVASPINAGTANVTLNSAGALSGGSVNGANLTAIASGGINLVTQVGTLLNVTNSGANSDISIANTGALHIQGITQLTSTGKISVANNGALTVDVGDGTTVTSDAGAITLAAGGISGNYPLTVNAGASVTSTSGSILLMAGNTINIVGTVTGAPVTQQPNLYSPPPAPSPSPPPPSIDQCVASPTLSGCTAVLPTLIACVTAPTTTGCTAVLPTLSACVTDPTAAGCATVLPTLSACVTAPATAGCTAVLPTLSACVTAPATAGCTAVLPTLSACVTAPATAGCTLVLPTLSTCVTAPTTAGCTAVLPTLSTCVTAPATAGCTLVLPTLSACVTAPATAGCTLVLPTLSTCVTAPTTAGCSAVVPTLNQCVSTPTLTGCTVVLPTLTQCTTSPTLAGCSAVLPSVSQCVAAPTSTGCAVVVPTAQTPANAAVNQVLNNTVNIINTSTATVTNVTAPGNDAGGGSGNKTSDKASDSKKTDDKKDTAVSDKTGVKKDDVAKKMYCN
jgi:filamentous hemagglutinin family protein